MATTRILEMTHLWNLVKSCRIPDQRLEVRNSGHVTCPTSKNVNVQPRFLDVRPRSAKFRSKGVPGFKECEHQTESASPTYAGSKCEVTSKTVVGDHSCVYLGRKEEADKEGVSVGDGDSVRV